MAEDEEVTLDDVNIMVSALIDVLVKKGIITEDEFQQSVDEYYEEE